MNQTKKQLKQNVKQAQQDLALAQQKVENALNAYHSAYDLLSEEVDSFGPRKGCIQIKEEDDSLIFLGHWYWKSATTGLDDESKYCKYFSPWTLSINEIPKECRICNFLWSYKQTVKAWEDYFNAREDFDKKQPVYEQKIQQAKAELRKYNQERNVFHRLFGKNTHCL